MEIIDSYNENGELLLKKYNNNYIIFFHTRASYYYCINSCKNSHCYCRDKDWIQGIWDGEFLYCNNYILAKNVFDYLKKNFDTINILNRYKLSIWVNTNIEQFMNEYYSDILYLMKLYIKYLFYIGIFNIYFYQKLKNIYYEKYKDILSIKFNYCDDNYTEVIFENNLSILVKQKYDITLQEKCLNVIRNCIFNYDFIKNQNKFISVDIDFDMNMNDNTKIKTFIHKFQSYHLFPNFSNHFNNLNNRINIETFFLKNKINDSFRILFDENLLNNIYDTIQKIDYINDIWFSMIESQAFCI